MRVPHFHPASEALPVKETPAEAAAILTEGSESLDRPVLETEPGMPQKPGGTIGSGAWVGPRDLAGHIETWEEVALRTIEDIRAGPSARQSGTRSPTRRPSTSSMPPRIETQGGQGLGGDGHEFPGNQRPAWSRPSGPSPTTTGGGYRRGTRGRPHV